MSLTQFAMVEELAFLIKDNLPCKHLVLSMEEAFINFLQDDMSPDGVLELVPMNSYDRLLLHRLADIFGFSHQSVGEGDDRHLILERCPESSIPSILVGDLLGQYDGFESLITSNPLSRRNGPASESKAEIPIFQVSLEDREAAYKAARERIFSMDESEAKGPVKQKPRSDPVVARRMIAHALGQRIKPSNQGIFLGDDKEYGELTAEMTIQVTDKAAAGSGLETSQETVQSGKNMDSHCSPRNGKFNSSASSHFKKLPQKPDDVISTKVGTSGRGRNERNPRTVNLKQEHMGAAKRMFAHALGFQSTTLSKSSRPSQPTE